MPDYKKLYYKAFNALTDARRKVNTAQRAATNAQRMAINSQQLAQSAMEIYRRFNAIARNSI